MIHVSEVNSILLYLLHYYTTLVYFVIILNSMWRDILGYHLIAWHRSISHRDDLFLIALIVWQLKNYLVTMYSIDWLCNETRCMLASHVPRVEFLFWQAKDDRIDLLTSRCIKRRDTSSCLNYSHVIEFLRIESYHSQLRSYIKKKEINLRY